MSEHTPKVADWYIDQLKKATDEINRAAIREGELHNEIHRLRVALAEIRDGSPRPVHLAREILAERDHTMEGGES